MLTNCSRCGKLYRAGSEEQANEPNRLCYSCVREDYLKTTNLAMLEMIQSDAALDVREIGFETSPGIFQLNEFRDGFDYCDGKRARWIWSIGKHLKTGIMLASLDTCFYQNPEYECLWLR
jgi:hypothetical protein